METLHSDMKSDAQGIGQANIFLLKVDSEKSVLAPGNKVFRKTKKCCCLSQKNNETNNYGLFDQEKDGILLY